MGKEEGAMGKGDECEFFPINSLSPFPPDVVAGLGHLRRGRDSSVGVGFRGVFTLAPGGGVCENRLVLILTDSQGEST